MGDYVFVLKFAADVASRGASDSSVKSKLYAVQSDWSVNRF